MHSARLLREKNLVSIEKTSSVIRTAAHEAVRMWPSCCCSSRNARSVGAPCSPATSASARSPWATRSRW